MGLATRCYDAAAAQPTDDRRVPYAILLGGDREDQTGMLESRAAEIQQCMDRPFGLKGRGGFRANCGPVRYADVFGVGSNAKTLVLDGTNEVENMVCDIRDGEGAVSVEKNGSNTWVLGGDQTFTGGITVEGGTLIVSGLSINGYGDYHAKDDGAKKIAYISNCTDRLHTLDRATTADSTDRPRALRTVSLTARTVSEPKENVSDPVPMTLACRSSVCDRSDSDAPHET